MSIPRVLIVEGIDRIGKGTFIDMFYRREGFRPTVKYGKPPSGFSAERAKDYQADSMLRGFNLIQSVLGFGGSLIFDRFHLGETVYSPRYRGYDGNYVFGWEETVVRSVLNARIDLGLLLLHTDFPGALLDDGDSVGPFDANKAEQDSFIEAFNRSAIHRKVMVQTAIGGHFRNPKSIYDSVVEAFSFAR